MQIAALRRSGYRARCGRLAPKNVIAGSPQAMKQSAGNLRIKRSWL